MTSEDHSHCKLSALSQAHHGRVSVPRGGLWGVRGGNAFQRPFSKHSIGPVVWRNAAAIGAGIHNGLLSHHISTICVIYFSIARTRCCGTTSALHLHQFRCDPQHSTSTRRRLQKGRNEAEKASQPILGGLQRLGSAASPHQREARLDVQGICRIAQTVQQHRSRRGAS